AHPREDLAALALGAFEPEEAATVRAHVEGCPACREELDRLAALPALLDLVPGLAAEGVAPAPAALEDAVLARIDDARRTAPPRPRPRRRFALRIAAPAWGLAGAAHDRRRGARRPARLDHARAEPRRPGPQRADGPARAPGLSPHSDRHAPPQVRRPAAVARDVLGALERGGLAREAHGRAAVGQ